MIVISLYDFTGEAVRPWADAGYDCYCYDIQHPIEGRTVGNINYMNADLHDPATIDALIAAFRGQDVRFVMGWPVCTDMAVSGAAHFAKKREADPDFQTKAAGYAMDCARLAETLGVPYMVENPVSVLSTLWRKPDHTFHPFEFGGYIPADQGAHPTWPDYIAPFDAYSKKTCLWTGGGFVMPDRKPVECDSFGSSTQHRKLGGKSIKTKNIRSATPRGFSRAIFEANQ
jgi:hypothetical protein